MADALKTGSFDDLADSMAGAIDAAMQEEWQAAKGESLPGGPGEQDRHILFAAVAKDTSTGHRHRLDFHLED